MELTIRDAQPADRTEWLRLWNDYLAFYYVDLADEVTEHTWARILDPASRVSMRVALLATAWPVSPFTTSMIPPG